MIHSFILSSRIIGFASNNETQLFQGPQKKQDVLFFKRNGPEVYFHLYESILKEDNDLDNYTCAFRTAVLWCLEVPVDEV